MGTGFQLRCGICGFATFCEYSKEDRKKTVLASLPWSPAHTVCVSSAQVQKTCLGPHLSRRHVVLTGTAETCESAERMGSGWTLSWLGHGCSGRTIRTDGVWVNVIMVGTWMLWQNGWGLGGRYHGWDMDALAERSERMGSGWTLSWLGHGCSGRADGVWVDVIMHVCVYMCVCVCAEDEVEVGPRGEKGWANDQVGA